MILAFINIVDKFNVKVVDMLDAFIIEELKRREQRNRQRKRPVLEIPSDDHVPEDVEDDEESDDEDEDERGVVIIDFSN